MSYTLKDIRKDLNIEGKDYQEFYEECKPTLKKVVNIMNKERDLIPVFESDLDREQDFLEETNRKMVIVHEIDGVVLYRTETQLNVFTNGGTISARECIKDDYIGIDLRFTRNLDIGVSPRVLIQVNKDNNKVIQVSIWQNPKDKKPTRKFNLVKFTSWDTKNGNNNIQVSNADNLVLLVPGGLLECECDEDDEYPAIEVSLKTPDNDYPFHSIVRLRFEYNDLEGVRLFTFEDPEYDFDNVYYFDVDKQHKINLGYEMIRYIQEFISDMTDTICTFSNLGFSFEECNQLVSGDFTNDYTVLHNFDKLLNEIFELVHDDEEVKQVLAHIGFFKEDLVEIFKDR